MVQTIFFHMPKVAGESLRQIFPDGTLFVGHDYYHKDAHHLYFDTEKYLKKFVVAFVRNPYDRVVSAFHYLNAGGNGPGDRADRDKYIKQYNGRFDHFVKKAFDHGDIMNQIHFMTQSSWIYYRGVNLCNYIGKYEEMSDDIDMLDEIIELKSTKLPELNKSIHKHYEEYYTQELKDIVYNWYQQDFYHFGYER